jgi:hypothetical protein
MLQNKKICVGHQRNDCSVIYFSQNKPVTFVFRILLGAKLEPDRSCFVLSCRVLMLTDKCELLYTCSNYVQRAPSSFALLVYAWH